MKLIKLFCVSFLLANALCLTSCGDDDCTAPDIAANIVGEWSVLGSDVEFQSDGTLIDPDDAIFGFEVNGVPYDQKSYVVTNTTLEVTAATADGSASSSSEFEIVDNQCDKITLGVFGLTVDMNRR